MKKINKNTIIIALITLCIGFIVGNLTKGTDTNSAIEKHEHTDEGIWTCSMHLQIQRSEAGKCPICGMDLVKIDRKGTAETASLKMSESAMKLANVVTAKVQSGKAVKNISLTGKIKPDERYVSSQSSHIDGRIEKLLVSYTGEFVKKGQVIAYVYSPELVNAEKELFVAHRMKDTQPELFAAAKEKLKNWKLTNSQIEEILTAGKPKDQFPILSDLNGVVVDKKVNPGDHVMEGESMFQIADLSRLWLLLEINESEISWVKVGDHVKYTIQSFPEKEFEGTISFIDPVINPKTRVAFARVTIQNPDDRIKPEMFASAVIESSANGEKERLLIPKSAIMWTGQRSIVYVKSNLTDASVFQLREVTLGAALGEEYIVTDGLSGGEEIVVNGAFSVDAAAQLAGKPSMMNKQESQSVFEVNESTQIPDNPVEQDEVNTAQSSFKVPQDFKNNIMGVYKAYIPVKEALVESDASKAKSHSLAVIKTLNSINPDVLQEEAKEEWIKDLQVLKKQIYVIINEADLIAMREALSPLSDQLYHTIKKFEVKTGGFRQYCPMAFDYKGAYWLSDSDEVLNPYFGDEMLTCGNVEEEM